VLRVDDLAVQRHVEDSARASDELGLHAEPLLQFGRQTDGPRLVASHRAVLDLDRHRVLLPGVPSPSSLFSPKPRTPSTGRKGDRYEWRGLRPRIP
jgi:hypothetical protein